ncbi:hypothetical protein DOE51_10150 [Bdellovibrio sp. NC01]|nr:hypothetical protein DOE51_10150 [Bdellovibrio sp. NC01]
MKYRIYNILIGLSFIGMALPFINLRNEIFVLLAMLGGCSLVFMRWAIRCPRCGGKLVFRTGEKHDTRRNFTFVPKVCNHCGLNLRDKAAVQKANAEWLKKHRM